MSIRAVLLIVIVGVLSACGGSGNLPPVDVNSSALPGTVTGSVFLSSPLKNATVTFYEYNNGQKGKRLATTTTEDDGQFFVQLKSLSRPIYVESTGGRYQEYATDNDVTLGAHQRVSVVMYYDEGTDITLTLSPLTHLITALSEYQYAHGESPVSAILKATETLNDLFDLEIAQVQPHVLEMADIGGVAESQLEYGFLLAGLSGLAKSLNEENSGFVSEVYTTIHLVDAFYRDMVADGRLDGFSKVANESKQLAFGVVDLTTETYRVDIAQYLLAMTTNHFNKTEMTSEDFLTYALAYIARESNHLSSVAEISSDVDIYNLTPIGSFYNKTFVFSALVNQSALVKKLDFKLNGNFLASTNDFVTPAVTINTLAYADGEHILTAEITDILDNKVARDFKVHFDNSSPFVNVTSSTATAQAAMSLSGDYGDNAGSGVKSIRVQGNNALLGENATWSAQVALSEGVNQIELVLSDWAGNTRTQQVDVIRDIQPPIINLKVNASSVRFSDGLGGSVVGTVATQNSVPFYLATDDLSLGNASFNKNAFQQNGLSYLVFGAVDPVISSATNYIPQANVTFSYRRNGVLIKDSELLAPVNNEYLVPMIVEKLGGDFINSLPSDEHVLTITAEDAVGNQAHYDVTFKLDFVVPQLSVAASDDFSTTLAALPFANRQSLYGTEQQVMSYRFSNTTDADLYFSFSNDGAHTAQQRVEQLVREHLVRLRTTTQWRLGRILNVLTLCADSEDGVPSLAYVTDVASVFEYDGGQFVQRSLPAPSLGDAINVSSDAPVAPVTTPWQAAVMPNTAYKTQQISIGNAVLSYEYDYIIADTFSGHQQPASVRNWTLTMSGGASSTCTDFNFFGERKSYAYISEAGYPKNILSTVTNDKSINNKRITVRDETQNAEVLSINGWYRVPAGSDIVIEKKVLLPSFELFNDSVVANPASFSSYSLKAYDKAISWSMANDLSITLAHDVGLDNIHAVTPTSYDVTGGGGIYVLSR